MNAGELGERKPDALAELPERAARQNPELPDEKTNKGGIVIVSKTGSRELPS